MTTDKGQAVTGKGNETEHHSYAVRFGLDGGTNPKPGFPGGLIQRIASLGSDQLLALSYNRATRAPELQLLDSDGAPVTSISIPTGLTDYATLKQGESGDSLNASKADSSVSAWQFMPASVKVLLYRPGSNGPILEIGKGGLRREVPVASWIRAFRVYSLYKTMYARFRRLGTAEGMPPSQGDMLLAELNPNDGSVERLFKLGSKSIFDVACEVDGEFMSFSTDKDGKFPLSSTHLPH